MLPIYFIDFEDSFSYNILAQAEKVLARPVQLISYKNLHEIEIGTNLKGIFIFGPGPGHPADYPSVRSLLDKICQSSQAFFMGICLGHQIFWHAQGYQVSRSKFPRHGVATDLVIPNWHIFPTTIQGTTTKVQRYNSLAVKNRLGSVHLCPAKTLWLNGELEMSLGERFITYQFHPESVGTSLPALFFQAILILLKDERALFKSNRWNLRPKNTEATA